MCVCGDITLIFPLYPIIFPFFYPAVSINLITSA